MGPNIHPMGPNIHSMGPDPNVLGLFGASVRWGSSCHWNISAALCALVVPSLNRSLQFEHKEHTRGHHQYQQQRCARAQMHTTHTKDIRYLSNVARHTLA
jgi:hypothetical protein